MLNTRTTYTASIDAVRRLGYQNAVVNLLTVTLFIIDAYTGVPGNY